MERCIRAVDLEMQGLLECDAPPPARCRNPSVRGTRARPIFLTVALSVAGGVLLSVGTIAGIEQWKSKESHAGLPEHTSGLVSLTAKQSEGNRSSVPENRPSNETERQSSGSPGPGEREGGIAEHSDKVEIGTANVQKPSKEDVLNETISWTTLLNPVVVAAAVQSEVGAVATCVQQDNSTDDDSIITLVSLVQPCMRQTVKERAQHGLVVPLDKFKWPVPSTWSWIFSSFVVLGMLGACFLAVRRLIRAHRQGNFKTEFRLWPDIDKVAAELQWDPDATQTHEKQTLQCLRSEVIIQNAQQFLVASIGIAVGLVCGSPPFVVSAALYVLPALRVASIERRAFQKIGEAWSLSGTYEFLASKMEIVDASSDGLALAAVVLLEMQDGKGTLVARMSAAWGSGLASWVLPLMGQAHGLSCAMLSLMLLSTLGTVLVTTGSKLQKPMLDFAGFGMALAVYPQKVENGHIPTASFKGFFRVAGEAIPQLYLQGSAVMMRDLSLVEQPLLALSICSTYFTALAKLFAMIAAFLKNAIWSEKPLLGRRWVAVAWWLSCCLPVLIPFFIVNLAFARVFVAQTCETHIWGLTTGCVVAPALM
mmetsp:Transcript_25028/g.54450  ORF Transcript_25028/g.54450 Transcript_25028/m.54450 type:complete len:594 (+) Transcript_25028:76-1857(+)